MKTIKILYKRTGTLGKTLVMIISTVLAGGLIIMAVIWASGIFA